MGSEPVVWLLVLADEHRFGTPDRWPVEQDADVGGDAQAAGMGVAVSINQQHIRLNRDALQGSKNRWAFAKGEKTWNIGELHPVLADHDLALAKRGKGHDHNGGEAIRA